MKIFLSLIFLCFSLIACNTRKNKTAENDIDAAREFLEASLHGEFDVAKKFMLQDSSNLQYLHAAERIYEGLQDSTKRRYREASIQFYSPAPVVNDSTTIIIFSNSYKNDHDTLRVIKANNQWLVDLKYLYEHDMDTIYTLTPKTDTLN